MFKRETNRPINLSGTTYHRLYKFAPDESGLVIDAVAERLKHIKEIGDLVDTFAHWSTKFKFGTTSRDIWERKYQFSNSGANFLADSVVNSGQSSVGAYVEQITLYAHQDKPPVIMLTGGIGAGKSSFNKYVTTCYHDEMKHAAVIASRIEFQKLMRHLQSYPGIEIKRSLNSFVISTLLRDIALYIYGHEQHGKDAPFSFSDKCRLTRDSTLINSENKLNLYGLRERILQEAEGSHYIDLLITENEIDKFFKQFSKYPIMKHSERSGFVAFWTKYFLLENSGARIMAGISEIFVDLILREHRPFLIFDGFDFIGVNDFKDNSTLQSLLNWLSSTVIEDEGLHLPLSGKRLTALTQITIRESTNQIFWQDRLASHSQVSCIVYKVETPSVEAVIDGLETLVSYFAPSSTEVGAVWSKMLNASVNYLVERLRQPSREGRRDFESADLFQNNSRHLINFLKDVLELELDRSYKNLIRNKSVISHQTLANEMRENFEEMISHRSYALVQILLSSRSNRYQNFLSVQSEENGHIKFAENDNGSGYIGNVFNYHAPYDPQRGLREFTHKLLILHLLASNVRTYTLAETADYIGFDFDFTKVALQILIRENMVEALYDVQHRDVLYRTTKLGQIVFDHLIYELSYIEAVFFGISVPSAFIDPDVQDVNRSVGTVAWVHGSFTNVALMLRMARTAGKAALTEIGIDVLAPVIDEIARSMDVTFQRIAHGTVGPAVLTHLDIQLLLDRQSERLGW